MPNMFLFENEIRLSTVTHVDEQTLTQVLFLKSVEEMVRNNSLELRRIIINSPRSVLYRSPGEFKPGIAQLAEQLIENRKYFLSLAHKKINRKTPARFAITCEVKFGWFGTYHFKHFSKKSACQGIPICDVEPGRFLFAQALLPHLYETQGQWKQLLNQSRYMDISAIFMRVPTVSIFSFRISDMLRIMLCLENKILARILEIESDLRFEISHRVSGGRGE